MSYVAILGAGLRGEGYNLKPFIDTLESSLEFMMKSRKKYSRC